MANKRVRKVKRLRAWIVRLQGMVLDGRRRALDADPPAAVGERYELRRLAELVEENERLRFDLRNTAAVVVKLRGERSAPEPLSGVVAGDDVGNSEGVGG